MEEQALISLLSDLKHRIFPRPFERLAVSGRQLIGVEIGVYRGDHAASLLEHLDIARLYLVDPYEQYPDYDEGRSHDGVGLALDRAREEAQQRLAPYADRVVWMFKKSSDARDEIPAGLDFVYIDGNHDERFVRDDLAGHYPKIRPGGVIGGHDFYNGFCREHDGVVSAVTRFTVEHGLTLQCEMPDWWIRK